jgi:hypothetical protein
VWQLLPVEQHDFPRSGTTMSVADLLRSLGVTPDADLRATGGI